MADYIERLDTLKELALLDTGEEEYTDNISRTRATIAIVNIPAADVVPVVHAYWRDTGSGQECSACKEIQYGYDSGRYYCPNCGAKMDEGEEK